MNRRPCDLRQPCEMVQLAFEGRGKRRPLVASLAGILKQSCTGCFDPKATRAVVVVNIEEENGGPRVVDKNKWLAQSCSLLPQAVTSTPPHAFGQSCAVIDDTGKLGPCSLLRTSRFNLRLLAKEIHLSPYDHDMSDLYYVYCQIVDYMLAYRNDGASDSSTQ
jgi:hypothetical protein